MSEVVFLGLPELKVAIEERVVAIRAAKAEAVNREAELIAEEVRRTAPYLEGDDPDGHIRDDVKVEHEGTHAKVEVKNRHGAFQEFGTSRNGAQPYMGPAAETSRRRFPEMAAQVLRKAAE